ncbi:hypothetical protein [Staphylococcus gallinarum]|uniref:hypothetical protein n=1 Tax=Staphylococcus gallinarum TaxID=1293 RepID=UPI000D1E8F79|nr:hypothetical protein [Staphylococcus gallinarum]PTK88626.1 hypothetical protein BUZ13_12905 [Staphylococcus gallinarum]RIO85894.1 hypothetical protein BUZ06_13980 [Staphylococcus gallinarum]
MESKKVLIQNVDMKTFNGLYNIKLRKNMTTEKVIQQTNAIFTLEVIAVETNHNEILKKVNVDNEEYIINIENIFYLCVKEL